MRRTGGEFSLLMIDFDNFKALNDNLGHDFGNLVLRTAGAFFQNTVRRLDVPCRFGGEEFVIVLPGTGLREAVNLAERLRAGVENFQLTSAGRRIPVTISAGVDTFRPYDQATAEELLAQADQYLLQAKKSGNNRVCHPAIDEQSDGISDAEKAALMNSFAARKN